VDTRHTRQNNHRRSHAVRALLADLSARFVDVWPSDVDRIIHESLRDIMEALDVSTARF
jgi:hypothetical protein